MTEWVALLRGVNVGGVTIRNAELAALMSDELGFDDVRTILASGNATFTTDAGAPARAALTRTIERALGERFGYDAWIVLVTRAEAEAAVRGFPFDENDRTRQPWVVFGSDGAVLDGLAAVAASLDPTEDPLARGSGVIYWHPRIGTTTQTPFAKLLARKTYRASTTNRNLRTLQRIIAR